MKGYVVVTEDIKDVSVLLDLQGGVVKLVSVFMYYYKII
jgi:hypothetical protein